MGYNKELKVNQRVRVKVAGFTHHVLVKEVTTSNKQRDLFLCTLGQDFSVIVCNNVAACMAFPYHDFVRKT